MFSAFTASARFPHRTNHDGTIDSICPRCYVTIGTSTREADLRRIEAAHVCSPGLLKHYHGQSDTPKKPPSKQRNTDPTYALRQRG